MKRGQALDSLFTWHLTVEVKKLHSEPLNVLWVIPLLLQCNSHVVAAYLPCILMSKAALAIHAHETGMTWGKAECSENYYCLALLPCLLCARNNRCISDCSSPVQVLTRAREEFFSPQEAFLSKQHLWTHWQRHCCAFNPCSYLKKYRLYNRLQTVEVPPTLHFPISRKVP